MLVFRCDNALRQVYDRLEEDVGVKLTEHVGKMVSQTSVHACGDRLLAVLSFSA